MLSRPDTAGGEPPAITVSILPLLTREDIRVGGTALVRPVSPATDAQGNYRQDLLEHAVSLPDGDAAVTATYQIVPRLSHRREIYMWPNPWVASYWAVAGEDLPDPSRIEWLVLDLNVVGDRELLDQILAADAWQIHVDQNNLLVAERIGS